VKDAIRISFIALLAIGAAGCGHEARVTGPTQCFAPRNVRVAQASPVASGNELTASNPVAVAANQP
jgi:hypothetical protein